MSVIANNCPLPVELIHHIVSMALADHLDDLLVGTQSEARLPFCQSDADPGVPREQPDLVESLFVASYQLHHITSKIVSSFSASGPTGRSEGAADEAKRSPWLDVAKTRELRTLAITPNLTKATQIRALICLRTGPILVAYRLVFCTQYQLAIVTRMQSWPHVVPRMESILSLQDVHSARATNQEIALTTHDVLALCPSSFRDVLAPRVRASTRDIAIFHEYEIRALELETYWRMIAEPYVTDSLAIEACVYGLTRLIRHVRDAGPCAHVDWDCTVPFVEALDEKQLEVWCKLLRQIGEAEDADERLADARDAARALLDDFEPRLERMQRPRAESS